MTNNTCRICLDEESSSENPMIHPCKCNGSMKFIHRNCLQTWRETNNRAFYECDICKYKYKFTRTKIANILSNPYVIFMITLIIHIIIAIFFGTIITYIYGTSELNVLKTMKLPKFMVYLISGNFVMGLCGFIILLISIFNIYFLDIFFPRYRYTSFWNWEIPRSSSNDDGCGTFIIIMIIIMAVIGICYVFYVTWNIISIIVDNKIKDIKHMIENVD